MHHFTQLGFTDNLELKEEDSNRNRLNTLLVCRTETINLQTSYRLSYVIFFFNPFGEQTLVGYKLSRVALGTRMRRV